MLRVGISLLVLSGIVLAADPPQVKVDEKVPAFNVMDLEGKKVAFADFSKDDTKAWVVVFWSTTCPICAKQYDRLVEIADSYKEKGVRFVLVDPNPSESADDLKAYTDKQKLTLPFYRDTDKAVMTQFAASVTPACYLIGKEGVLRYQGMIEQGKPGKKKYQAYLTTAIDSLLDGKEIETKSTMPSG